MTVLQNGNGGNLKVNGPGAKTLKVYDDSVHHRQSPSDTVTWQDSVVLAWWDDTHSIGGFHRLGHEPNYPGGGSVSLWNNLIAPEGTYKNTTFLSLRETDKLANGGFGCGDETCITYFENGKHVWKINDGHVSAELYFEDTGPNVDCFPKRGSLAEEFASAHFDIPGVVTGWLKIGDKKYVLTKGLGIRDHGWGIRDWTTILSHRWVVGTCGKELGFICLAWHSTDDAMANFGWVIRNGEVTMAAKLDILTYVEIDAATNRGGHVTITLTTGEVLEIEIKPYKAKGIASFHHGVCVIDRMCEFQCGDLRGMCDFETTANIMHGTRKPLSFTNSIIDNGWHPN